MSRQVQEMDQADVRECFTLYDTRGDGKIDARYLGDVIRALNVNPTEGEIRKFGYNDPDQRIDFETFYPIYQALNKNRDQSTPEDLIQGFRVFDKDQNGQIRAAELRHLLTSLGEKMREDEVEQLLNGFEDAQGNVNYEEFVRAVMSG